MHVSLQSVRAFLTGLSTIFGALALCIPVQAAEITIACGSVGQERQLCEEGVARWSEQTGHQAKVIATPDSSTERLAMYQLLLRERHNTVDVYMMDVIWPGLLHEYLLDLSPYIDDVDAFFPNLIANDTINGRLIALPWYVDTGLLYYRKDLLEQYNYKVPETWDDLERIATDVQRRERARNPEFWGYVWQGSDYEGLTCNVVEWLVSHGAGNVVDEDQTITVNNELAVQALSQAAGWVGSISPQAVLEYREEDARAHFERGDALFMRNWPYAWSLGNNPETSSVAGNIGVAVLPRGVDGQPTGALGGWHLGVTQATQHPEVAADLVRFLTSEAEQRRRADYSYLPTRTVLYSDIGLTASNALFAPVGKSLTNVALRPSSATGRIYKYVSRYLSQETHAVLAGEKPAEEAVQSIAQRIVEKSLGEFSMLQ